MEKPDVRALAQQMIDAVRGYVARAETKIIAALDQKIAAIPAGPKGDKGDVGERGERGEVGAIGARGPDGLPGARGEPGPRGEVGAIGERGPQGERGDQGDVGAVGMRGERGEQGPRGEAGERGERGELGAPGPQGKQGDAGPAGAVGMRGEKGERGEPGERGATGADGVQGATGPAGPAGERGPDGPRGERGLPGESIKGDAGQQGERGEKGEPGERGPVGLKGDQGAPGRDAKDVDPLVLKALVGDEVKNAVAALVRPQDGKNGADGRDAAELEILPSIDESKSYRRGTWASHNGGLIRAARQTDPVADGALIEAGWVVMVEGVAAVVVTQGEDPRQLTVAAMLTSRTKAVTEFRLPVMVYREVWHEGEYDRGDVVTWGGSAWHCQQKTSDKPGASPAWKLMVKEGARGKDGTAAPGPRDVVRTK